MSYVDLAVEFSDCGARARGAVDSACGDDAVEGCGDEDLAIGDYGYDVLVRANGADAVVVAEAVGDSVAEVAELAFGCGVVWVAGFVVEDGVFEGDGVFGVWELLDKNNDGV